ncbi:unnamed protein product [Ambrosiozyma monospora]|uniref:Unnamed protein product n=1 Tax=Ambrosiozyma monospora TaxID=43982 RepID=A0ACB5TQ47_AMBMO|nr:unnamed protein product [Ambrosiozyma monospora]
MHCYTHPHPIYTLNLTIGSNNQPVTLLVDTGSSDLWVVNSNNSWCSETSQGKGEYSDDDLDSEGYENELDHTRGYSHDCSVFGTFSPTDSDTWKATPDLFSIMYGGGSWANGTWGQDTITIEGVEINDVYIAQSDESNQNYGILGIGYQKNEATNGGFTDEPDFIYDNLPITMKNQGLIHKNTYSIYLDEISDTDSAVLLFGAIDHSKYTGDLMLFPVASNSTSLTIYLDGIYMGDGDSNVTIATGPARALLDTGAPMTTFPDDVMDAISDQIGAYSTTDAANYTTYFAECSSLEDQSFTFDFMGYNLTIPLSKFVVEKSGSNCTLGLNAGGLDSADGGFCIFGDTFLSNVYFVVDLDDNEMALGLANTECTCEDIEVITDTIPSATQAPNYSTSQSGFNYLTVATQSSKVVKNSGAVATATSSSQV